MTVVAIGAHPDDAEIGAGGACVLHDRYGQEVIFLVVTSGGEIKDPKKREEEAKEAASVLGVDDVRFLGFSDTQVPYNDELVKSIEDHLSGINPSRVYIHSQEDTHQDHRKTALASVAATRNCPQVLAFESPSTRPSFEPQHYIPVPSDVLELKVESIRTHQSQSKKKYLEAEAMEGLARFRGRQANTEYAESFHVIRSVEQFERVTEAWE